MQPEEYGQRGLISSIALAGGKIKCFNEIRDNSAHKIELKLVQCSKTNDRRSNVTLKYKQTK